MKDIKTTDANTVVLTLTQPTGIVPSLLTLPPASIMPKKLIDGVSPSTAVPNLICTGPYKVTEFKPDQQAVLTRFADYQSRTDPTSGAAGAKPAPAENPGGYQYFRAGGWPGQLPADYPVCLA